MRIGVSLPNVGLDHGKEMVLSVAEAADRLGFDSVWAAHHVTLPYERTSQYPYQHSGTEVAMSPGMQWLDPLVTLSMCVAATDRVRLGTSVLVLPYRNPVNLAPEAAGWDWTGLNLDDGGALMAFRMRGRDGVDLWAGGSHRDAAGRVRVLARDEVAFVPGRTWRSPRTGIAYPVTFRVRAANYEVSLAPLLDDQELDARGSVGIVYWEGAVRATSGGMPAGRGYLELTGYGTPLTL